MPGRAAATRRKSWREREPDVFCQDRKYTRGMTSRWHVVYIPFTWFSTKTTWSSHRGRLPNRALKSAACVWITARSHSPALQRRLEKRMWLYLTETFHWQSFEDFNWLMNSHEFQEKSVECMIMLIMPPPPPLNSTMYCRAKLDYMQIFTVRKYYYCVNQWAEEFWFANPDPPLSQCKSLLDAGGRGLEKQSHTSQIWPEKADVWSTHACGKEKPIRREHERYEHTHKTVHTLYLFDIVACLCTCFNKQNIHVFRSLFSLLCGYLSVMSHDSPYMTHKHPQGRAHTATDIDKKTKGGKKIQTVIILKWINKSCPFLLLLSPLLNTKSFPTELLAVHRVSWVPQQEERVLCNSWAFCRVRSDNCYHSYVCVVNTQL